MDERAISIASDFQLKEMGIAAQGDILLLREFIDRRLSKRPSCSQESHDEQSREQKKKRLIEKLLLGKRSANTAKAKKGNLKSKNTETTCAKKKTRKVKLAWQHYNEQTKRFMMVRESTGGGQREMALATSSDYHEILASVIDLFFPNGTSSRGEANEMEFTLANFKCDVISSKDFSLGNYISANKLTKPRLYLLSRHKSSSTDPLESDGSEDGSLEKFSLSMEDEPGCTSTPEKENQQLPDPFCMDGISDDEIVFKGCGLYDSSLLLDDTIVDPVKGNAITDSRYCKCM